MFREAERIAPALNREVRAMKSLARWIFALTAIFVLSTASWAQIAVGISVRVGPPALPVYAQPICPGPGYVWTPGYWSWNDDDGYYWVPGTWVVAPVGMLWTPGWWGWGGGLYVWHAGYWGPHVGFYGGINYGFGYTGVGFVGGEWRGGAFYYNRSVTNVSVTNVTNVYTKTVVVNRTTVTNVSYNGGEGGVRAEPTREERVAEHEHHTAALETQSRQEHLASQNRENFARVNQGKPAIAATARAGDFSGHAAIPARAAGGSYHAPTMSPREARGASPENRGSSPSTADRPNAGGNSRSSVENRSNNGFRSFTPPNAKQPNRNEGSKPAQGSSGGFRSFSPPSKNNGNVNANTGSQNKAAQNHGNQSYWNQTRETNSRPGNQPRPQSQSHVTNAPHPAPQPRQSSPKPETRKSSSPPPEHKGRG